jgi:hypothetical protein
MKTRIKIVEKMNGKKEYITEVFCWSNVFLAFTIYLSIMLFMLVGIVGNYLALTMSMFSFSILYWSIAYNRFWDYRGTEYTLEDAKADIDIRINKYNERKENEIKKVTYIKHP